MLICSTVLVNLPVEKGVKNSQPKHVEMFATWFPECASPGGTWVMTGSKPPLGGPKKSTPLSWYWFVTAVPTGKSSKVITISCIAIFDLLERNSTSATRSSTEDASEIASCSDFNRKQS